MMFKGFRVRRAPSVVRIRIPDDPTPCYVKFGRICKATDKGAIETTYRYRGDGYDRRGRLKHRAGDVVFAKPIKLDGHSRTDMAYGADGRVYVMHDGVCYTAPLRRRT